MTAGRLGWALKEKRVEGGADDAETVEQEVRVERDLDVQAR